MLIILTEILDRTLENALFCVTKTIDKIMTGEIETGDLIISKQLRMDITKYRIIFPHVAAAHSTKQTNGKQPKGRHHTIYLHRLPTSESAE